MPIETALPDTTRRRLLGRALFASPWLLLAGCAAPWPDVPTGRNASGSSSALQHLQSAALGQGLAAWRGLQDLSVTLSDTWWPHAGLLQAGAGPTGPAGPIALELRLLPRGGLLALRQAQAGDGDRGQRQLLQQQPDGLPQVWLSGQPVADVAARRAAAVVADLHRLLLLGAIALAEHPGPMHWAEPVSLDGRRCDHLHLLLQPGLGGGSGSGGGGDRVSLFIDRDQGWLRRLRVSLTGLGLAVDQPLALDLSSHRRLHGLLLPGRWDAGAAAALPGRTPQSWRLQGLDINRGYSAADLAQAPWAGRANAPVPPLSPPLPG